MAINAQVQPIAVPAQAIEVPVQQANISNLVVFYSWQDEHNNTNKRAIRSTLERACATIEAENAGLQITIQESVNAVPGSPNITQIILDRIRSCDVFVGDVTIINSNLDQARKTPNPNVIFELGYAVAHIGWERVVMVFNDHFGRVEDLPFDIRGHRISRYTLSPDDPRNRNDINNLESMLSEAIRSILNTNPPKPYAQTSGAIRRQRDIENIRWVMSAIHLPTIDRFIEFLPGQTLNDIFIFWEVFNARITSSLFHIYNESTMNALRNFYKAWDQCLSYEEYYQPIVTGDSIRHIYIGKDETFNKIRESQQVLFTSFRDLLDNLRNNYDEISLDETNNTAWREYVRIRDEDRARMNDLKKE